MQKRIFTATIWLVLISCTVFACSGKPLPTNQTTPTGDSAYPAANDTALPENTGNEIAYPAPPAGFVLQLIKPDGSVQAFTSDQITKLPSAKITIDNKTVEGPTLSEVLKAAGVSSFDSLIIGGPAGSIWLKKDQVNDQVLITLSAKDTATAYVASTGDKPWIGIVYEIRAQ